MAWVYREKFHASGLEKKDLEKGLKDIFPDNPSSKFDVTFHVRVPRSMTQKEKNDIEVLRNTNQIGSKTDEQIKKEYF
ncbi:hypothetical protein CFRS1_v010134 [Colletotrichum fructicola]|nr:hypothetical protein CFRS1_v010134 [Colletotrichum fructicola]